MTPLNSLEFPLSGASLIEASAGTGKTYTIVNLYLRLLLGHQCQARTVEQILVVTFTNAATSELKARIRQRLSKAYLDFFVGRSEDRFIQSLIDQSPDRQDAMLRLAVATRQMDEASVFTIHGFCQRMLTEHAFESGVLYEQTLVMDEAEWLRLAVADFWRKHIVTQNKLFVRQLLSIWPSPTALQYSIRPLINRQVVVSGEVALQQCHETFVQYCQRVNDTKRWWLDNQIGQRLSQAKLKANTRLGKTETYDYMLNFCQGDELSPQFGKDGWNVFTPEKLEKAKGKTSLDLSDLDFSRFEELDNLQTESLGQIRVAYSQHALAVIRDNLASNKARENILAPDDLLNRLDVALNEANGQKLADAISGALPVALIDEFQDTDATQFAIFTRIYQHASAQNALCWIMIGDPKQAIYAFRGADIFTYIEAKNLISAARHFTLATNWRSQEKLVKAINYVYQNSRSGFLFEDSIPFYAVEAANENSALQSKDDVFPSLDFQFLSKGDAGPVGWEVAQRDLSVHTANQIAGMLNQQVQVEGRSVRAGDCCVLVRDRTEAELIKIALQQAGIASVFLIRRSVYSSNMALDLYLLLAALANPNDEKQFRAALCCELFGYNSQQLEALFNDEVRWQSLVDQLYIWHQDWQLHGLMKVINQISLAFNLPQKLVAQYHDGARRVTDLRHLTELLQQQSSLIIGQSQLLHWFGERIQEPDHDNESQQLRLETDDNLVQIITMHASKGLEFPLVFIPFACRFREAKLALFHDQNHQLSLDYLSQSASLQAAEKERLAEDIRLLYVALTRAVYYCSVGVWNNSHARKKQQSEFNKTALGSLLLGDEQAVTEESIVTAIKYVSEQADIRVNLLSPSVVATQCVAPAQEEQSQLAIATIAKSVKKDWQLTSYSAISRQQTHTDMQDKPGMDEGPIQLDAANEGQVLHDAQKNRFTFLKGAQAGSFLHGVLENIDLNNPHDLKDIIAQQGQWFGIEDSWFETIHDWIREILDTRFALPESDAHLSLGLLKPDQVKVEMEFYLPLNQLKADDFSQAINQFYPQYHRHYQFDSLNGMLKGFIDLTFEYQGKYYVADYKSNYLGSVSEDYQQDALHLAMQEHDYHLQGILYILALHRWLTCVLPDYQYERHIGGAYYLFLRGMNDKENQDGVYFMRPDRELVEALDRLVKKELPAVHSQPDSSEGQMSLW